jgi:hypothetical protein
LVNLNIGIKSRLFDLSAINARILNSSSSVKGFDARVRSQASVVGLIMGKPSLIPALKFLKIA